MIRWKESKEDEGNLYKNFRKDYKMKLFLVSAATKAITNILSKLNITCKILLVIAFFVIPALMLGGLYILCAEGLEAVQTVLYK